MAKWLINLIFGWRRNLNRDNSKASVISRIVTLVVTNVYDNEPLKLINLIVVRIQSFLFDAGKLVEL